MRIAPAGTTDIYTIEKLAHAIWPECYGEILSKDQLDYMLNKFYSPQSLQEQIEKLHHHFILIFQGETAVGFADYSFKENSPSIYRLNKIYVLPSLQGAGYGKELLQYICELAAAEGARSVELNVNRHNPALHFYKKKGFEIDHEEDIDIGEGYYMNDYVMIKKIATAG